MAESSVSRVIPARTAHAEPAESLSEQSHLVHRSSHTRTQIQVFNGGESGSKPKLSGFFTLGK
jgi:hypothetical protein